MTLEEGSAVDIPVAGMEEKLGEETQAQKLAHQIALVIEEVAVLLSVRDERRVIDGNEKETQMPFGWRQGLEIVVSREETTGRPYRGQQASLLDPALDNACSYNSSH